MIIVMYTHIETIDFVPDQFESNTEEKVMSKKLYQWKSERIKGMT